MIDPVCAFHGKRRSEHENWLAINLLASVGAHAPTRQAAIRFNSRIRARTREGRFYERTRAYARIHHLRQRLARRTREGGDS